MKRSLIILIAMFALCLMMAAPVFAAVAAPVTDEAGILTDAECRDLNKRAIEIREQFGCEISVCVVKDMGLGDAFDIAKEVYLKNGFGYGPGNDGMMLFLSMYDRDYAMISYGYGNEAFTEYGKDAILDRYVLPLLGENKYYEAFEKYLNKSAEYLMLAADGAPFDQGTDPVYLEKQAAGRAAVVVIIPPIVALIVCLIFRAQMKTARKQRAAHNYIPEGGFVLTGSSDTYLYSTETRRTIESSSSGSSGHRSSGGFSGRSGKF